MVKFPDNGFETSGKLDGKDNPISGRFAGSTFTFAFMKSDDRGLKISEKNQGRPIYDDTVTVSPDGKTLTWESIVLATKQVQKAVYDRQ
jgi:hypothetical protein